MYKFRTVVPEVSSFVDNPVYKPKKAKIPVGLWSRNRINPSIRILFIVTTGRHHHGGISQPPTGGCCLKKNIAIKKNFKVIHMVAN